MDNLSEFDTPENRSPKRRPLLRFTVALLVTAIVATGLALLTNYLFFRTYYVDGDSMQPTLDGGVRNVDYDGDILVLNTIATPKRGDIIVFICDWYDLKNSDDNSKKNSILVKRVIGVAGDTVEIKDGDLYVNGTLQEEDYIKEPMSGYSYPAVTVPEGHFYVMGDNRNNSTDSRVIGCVPEEKIKGVCWLYKGMDGKLHLP